MKKMNVPTIIFLFHLLTGVYDNALAQQPFIPNYEESKVGIFQLPDPLMKDNGEKIESKKDWEQYRTHWIDLFQKTMFGKMPKQNVSQSSELISRSVIMDGMAVQYIWKLSFEGKHHVTVLGILPNTNKRVPVFLGLNFCGNQTTSNHTGIPISDKYVICNDIPGFNGHKAEPASRGTWAHRWPYDRMIEASIGSITVACGDFEEDKADGYKTGVRTILQQELGIVPEEWSAIGAWSWGLSRVMDFLETVPSIDAKKVILHGHSRLGKTALWAGANDRRFAAVISNESGEGGAALSRRNYGENLWRITNNFPHWFLGSYKQFAYKENELPFDQHILLSLIAPRPLYVASAEGDQWSDPKGEFLGAQNTEQVYNLYKVKGLGSFGFPELNSPIGDHVRYHIRTGKHDMNDYDWKQYIRFVKEKVL